jgi:hypothetical protein
MKKKFRFILALLLSLAMVNCSDSSASYDDDNTNYSRSCGTYNGHNLYKGPNGGCYYINSKGNKTYVDRKHCNC